MIIDKFKTPNKVAVITGAMGGNGFAIAIKVNERKVNLILENCKKEISKRKAGQFFDDFMTNYRDEADIIIYDHKL